MSVLILARDFDPTADRVVRALTEREAVVHRVNTAWFPTRMSFSVSISDARWSGTLTTPRGEMKVDEVSAVWYRSPEAYRMPEALTQAEARHAQVEAKYGLGGVLASLPALWCNHPSRAADAAYKPVQLVRAARAGLSVPDTVLTSEAETVRQFSQEGPTVTKLVGGMAIDEEGVRKNAYTRLLEPGDLVDLGGVQHTAHLFQRWVPKQRECRVIAIGEQITAAAITAGSTASYVDYRTDYPSLSYDLIEPPAQVIAGIRRLLDDLGLVYGALDFVITPESDWVFLEINPGGQFGFVEQATGSPLTEQLADLLMTAA